MASSGESHLHVSHLSSFSAKFVEELQAPEAPEASGREDSAQCECNPGTTGCMFFPLKPLQAMQRLSLSDVPEKAADPMTARTLASIPGCSAVAWRTNESILCNRVPLLKITGGLNRQYR